MVRKRRAEAVSEAAADRMVFEEGIFSCENIIIPFFWWVGILGDERVL